MRYVRVLVLIGCMLAATLLWVGYAVAEPITSPNQRFPQDVGLSEKNLTAPGFHKISDDTDAMSLEVPVAWKQVETGPWVHEGKVIGVFVAASPTLDDFHAVRKTPGVFMGVSHDLAHTTDIAALLGSEQRKLTGKCKFKERKNYTDPFYSGLSDAYVTCVNGQHDLLVVAVTPADRQMLILLRINLAGKIDPAVIARIFQTFQVHGIPGQDEHHDH